MNFPISELDFLATTSNFAKLLTIVKAKMKHLERDMQHYIDHYLKEMVYVNDYMETDTISCNIVHKKLDKSMELWMSDLQKQLMNLDLFNRAAALKLFVYFSNYLYVLRTPVKRNYDHPRKLPVYNIEFSKIEKNETPRSLLKDLSKLKRKKNLTKVNTYS